MSSNTPDLVPDIELDTEPPLDDEDLDADALPLSDWDDDESPTPPPTDADTEYVHVEWDHEVDEAAEQHEAEFWDDDSI